MIWLAPLVGALLLGSGLAIAYVVGGATVLAFYGAGQERYLAILPQQIFSKIDVFALMAMPLFILAGEIMNRGGVTRVLIRLAMAIVGRLPGGLGHVNVLTSVFFAGISGSAVADSAAVSNTLVPAMREQGYKLPFAAAITAASSIIGPIVPPSIVMIFYGALMGTSVTALFIAGIIPGLLLAGALMVANAFYAMRDHHPRMTREEVPSFFPTLFRALPALCIPFIIVGGIVLGWMTPTEAAAVAVVAATFAGMAYERIQISQLIEALKRTAMLSGSIFMIIAAVSALGYLGALERLPEMIAETVTQLGLGPVEYMILLNVIFLLSGMVLDTPVALALLVPLLAPVAIEQGADPIHLGIVLCFNLTLGLISPPLGGALLVVSTVTGINYWQLARSVLPFLLVEIAVLAVLVWLPEITLWLPRTMGLMGE
ncbi:TRAP transporter large permease [Pararhodobacter sp. CCB-MM2]|uniref:TRAP transporter large permease n=1 Tax=Pararhodobacter sp. CCB-MM2 TaxID=1786003 RepID=UPI000831E413|nr:TRAP transporter large permease [Pararhodobacter sp. CCB-MM2]MCA2013710.1 TRAP transporter large permease [Cereibacter sphaeroides]